MSKPLKTFYLSQDPEARARVREALSDPERFSLELLTSPSELEGREPPPDLLLADLDADSDLELCRQASQRWPATTLVALTRGRDTDAALEALRFGAHETIIKSEAALQLLPSTLTRLRDRHVLDLERHGEFELSKRLYASIPLLLGIADNQGRVVRVNAVFERVLGWSTDDLAGKPFTDILHDDDLPPTLSEFEALFRGRDSLGFENRYRTRDGEWRLIRWNTFAAGDLLYSIGEDITDQRRLERDLLRAQKLELVGTLVASVAHDFGNLLWVILGNTQLLSDELQAYGSPRAISRLQAIATAAEHSQALTRRLLSFSGERPERPAPCDLNALLRELEHLLRAIIGEALTLHIETAPSPAQVRIDKVDFEQILLNLLTNSRDAVGSGGILRCAIRCPKPEVIELVVSDNGCGMPEAVRAQVFQPFFTTKPKGQGTGLGLATVKRLADRSGATISIDSTPDVGTTITLAFPRLRDTSTSLNPRPARDPSFLVVEDVEALRLLFQEFLESLGYSAIRCASTAEAALELVDEAAPDILITDLRLPGLSGAELLARLRPKHPELRVILCSGHIADLAEVELDHSRERAVEKPIRLEVLRATLDELLQDP